MANEVFKGLFGFSPDELTQQRQAENEARAFKLAQLNPLEQISFQGYNAASGIRDSVKDIGRSLFNIEDPQMRDSTVLDGAFQEAVSSGLDPMTTKGMDFIISKAQQGGASPKILEKAYGMRQQVAMQEAKLGSEVALTKQREMEKLPKEVQLLNLYNTLPDSDPRKKMVEEMLIKEKAQSDPDIVRLQDARDKAVPGSQRWKELDGFIKAKIAGESTRGKTDVSIQMPGAPDAKKFGEAAGGTLGKEAVEVSNAQQQIIDTSNQALDILKQGIYAGPYGAVEMNAAKFSRGAYGSLDKVVNTEKFLNFVNSNVIPMLKSFGGSDTEKELKFLERLSGGDLSRELPAIEQAVKEGLNKANKRMERLKGQVQSVQQGKPIPLETPPEEKQQSLEDAFQTYYNSLPPGAEYIGPDGKRRKKGSK